MVFVALVADVPTAVDVEAEMSEVEDDAATEFDPPSVGPSSPVEAGLMGWTMIKTWLK